jgi:hypothetical protein
MEATARHFFGEPNRALSNKHELRFGEHGSMSVDLEKGVWTDHEAKEGGGVLDLVRRQAKLKNGAALDYLRNTVGVDLPDERPQSPLPTGTPKGRVVATYDYADEHGEVLFQVCRLEPKSFRQRRPDPSSPDGWSWSVKGVRQVPYRLTEALEQLAENRRVFIVEGEKDVDRLWAMGVPATCNAGGSGKWPLELAAYFSGARVVILPDNDDAGRNHRDVVAMGLREVASEVLVLELPDLPPKGDVSDWLDQGGTLDGLYRLVDAQARPWQPAPPASRFGAVTWLGLRAIEPRKDWTTRGLLFPADLGLIYGESRAGKSFLAADLGLAITRGVPFFDMECRPGPVVYQAGEGQGGLVSRLQAYGERFGVAGHDLPFTLLRQRINLYTDDGAPFIDELRQWAAWYGRPLSAVFIDTFSAATAGANENASEDVSRVLSNGKEIKEATGAAVIFVHHKNAGGTKARGHTSLFADADMALDVERDEETNERQFTIRKVKDGEDGKRFGFRLQPVQLGSDDDGKPITSCVIDPAQDKLERAGKQRPLPTSRLKFLRVLDDAILHRGGTLPPNANAPEYTRGVDFRQFTRLFRGISGVREDDPMTDEIRQAIKRDGEWLITNRLIGRDAEWIWITEDGRERL